MRRLKDRIGIPSVKSALLISATLLAIPAASQAQTTPPVFVETAVEIEGRIQKMDPAKRTLTVMGTTIFVPETAKISTPTNGNISWEQALARNIPGKPEGFLNATAIVIGVSTGATVVASDVALNPEENVALGYITQNSNGVLKLDGMEIVLMPSRKGEPSFPVNKSPFDERVPGGPLKNDFGFPLVRNSITPGTPVAAEGWWSDRDKRLYLWDLEVTGGEIANPQVPKISIMRAQCRQRAPNDIELEVRGATYRGTTTVPTAGVRIFRVDDNGVWEFPYPITVTSVPDVEDGRFALYRVDARLTNGQVGPLGAEGCPATLGVQLLDPTNQQPIFFKPKTVSLPVQALMDVDNRID